MFSVKMYNVFIIITEISSPDTISTMSEMVSKYSSILFALKQAEWPGRNFSP